MSADIIPGRGRGAAAPLAQSACTDRTAARGVVKLG